MFDDDMKWVQELIDAAPLPFLISQVIDGKVLYANQAFCDLVGVAAESLKGRTTLEWHDTPTDRVRALLELMHSDGGILHREVALRKADGSEVQLREANRARTIAGQQVIITVYSPIATREHMDADSLEQEEQRLLAQKMEAVGRLAGGIAHDFNNLLTVINGYSSLLLAQLPKDTPHRQEIDQIHQAGRRAAGLTQQLLEFTRHQARPPHRIDLNTLVRELSPMIQRLVGEHIECITALAPEPQPIKADPGRLEQVIMNLVVNARDAMPKGGKLTLETKILDLTVSNRRNPALRPGHYVLLSVTDTGCGMDAQTKARIFEPFFTTKEVGKGTGLGLATVYGIVKQSAGQISVYSEPGYGATFKIYLPRMESVEDPDPVISKEAETPNGRERVLVVEDEPAVRVLVVGLLRDHGYEVLEARHGIEGLVIAAQRPEPVHLLVTDVVMPQMSGGELAEKLVHANPDLKVLFMSGFSESAVVQQGLLKPGTTFLQKPFDVKVLVQKVRAVLDGALAE
jgi:two-component system cell cycle sensor histidine kinase/response regulator CckA